MANRDHAPEHIPPSSIEAEEAVLGSILINADSLLDVASFLGANDFFVARHMWIWEAIIALMDRRDAIDNLTLIQELRNRGQLDDIGGPAYVTYLINNTPTHIHAVTYGHIVKRAAVRRRLLNAAGDVAQIALEESAEIDEICNRAESIIMEATETKDGSSLVSVRQAAMDYYSKVEYLAAHKNELPGVPSGFYDLDAITHGWQKSNLILVAGRPGMGKSAFLKSAVVNAARLGKRIAIFSMEMTVDEIMERIYSEDTGIESEKLRVGNLTESEWQRFTESMARLSKLNIWIYDAANLTVRTLSTKCRRLYRKHGLDMIVVDYVQLMISDKDNEDNRNMEVSRISRGLKKLAGELHVPVLAAAQLSRKVEDRSDKHPQLADLRDSGSLEQDANVVVFLYRDSEYNKESKDPNGTEIVVAKHRGGQTGKVMLNFDKPRTRFTNRTKQNAPSNGVYRGGEK